MLQREPDHVHGGFHRSNFNQASVGLVLDDSNGTVIDHGAGWKVDSRWKMVTHGEGQFVELRFKPSGAKNAEVFLSQQDSGDLANRWPEGVRDSHETLQTKASLEGWYA
jgi:hypothetical protein